MPSARGKGSTSYSSGGLGYGSAGKYGGSRYSKLDQQNLANMGGVSTSGKDPYRRS